MGSGSSVSEVYAQDIPIVVVDSSFASTETVRIDIEDSDDSGSRVLNFFDQGTGGMVFKTNPLFDLHTKVLLLHKSGAVCCTIEGKMFEYKLYLGDSPNSEIGTVNVDYSPGLCLNLLIINKTTGEPVGFYLRSHWPSRVNASIYAGSLQSRVPVANIYSRQEYGLVFKHKYVLTVAPGVDSALMMVLCVIFDIHSKILLFYEVPCRH
mmetsp:Transcript_41645/g.67546  ORF Transcript_41645/g.67546 Transcript_41645/m.67546 type:complete len:208 (+) Transcript_41645:226-849(+)|eukprot:CAMPEP_0184645172 /NCGR_PEP_ID=MMETSP0308-20130426/1701_1 /TAXON_ID=38269 /ORGANISM="Gloeochaete witrockiana, Strain SAG 46.84" /LENGTH=207 /DNA_ID=CAMNT_0027074023 /DNA_START=187 /DNA_END=810 /DNA_ORIENTATION=+